MENENIYRSGAGEDADPGSVTNPTAGAEAAPDSTPLSPARNWDRIPDELKALRQWVIWKAETRSGRMTKVPYSAQDPQCPARTNDPETWAGFDEAVAAALINGAGIGFVFTEGDPYVGIDLDHVIHHVDGEVDMLESAIGYIDRLGGYTEISQSEEGIHIIVRAENLGRGIKRPLGDGAEIEIYSSGRYFVMTGNAVQGEGEIPDRGDVVSEIVGEMNARQRVQRAVLKARPRAPMPSPVRRSGKLVKRKRALRYPLSWPPTIEQAKELVRVADVWRELGLDDPPDRDLDEWNGRSPLRDEWRPSFSIYDEGRKWKDHGTGEGGDAINFLATATGLDSGAAARRFLKLAEGLPADLKADRIPRKKRRSPDVGRGGWPVLSEGQEWQWKAVAESRKIDLQAVNYARGLGILRFAEVFHEPAWVLVSDETGADGLPICAEARDLYGRPWGTGEDQFKVYTLPGSKKRVINLSRLADGETVALVEGAPDLLAAYHFLLREDVASQVVPVCVLGAGLRIPDDQLESLEGRRVRIFKHGDDAGENAATRWEEQLRGGRAEVDIFDCGAGMDLNDLAEAGYSKPLMIF